MSIRWLTRLEVLLTIGLVLGLLAAVTAFASTVVMAVGFTPNGMGIPLRAFGAPAPSVDLAADATISSATVEVVVRPDAPSPLAAGLYLLLWAPATVTGLLALLTLVRAIRRARSGDRALFSGITVTLLRRLGWILILGSLASALLSMFAEAMLASILLGANAQLHLPSSALLGTVVAGVVALSVSEIVRRGLVLLEEVEATV
ncbi:DUF2975 domain-containing protein [Microbispora sp. CA-135349]|uniref:DUF2975 domain-containing protein n=1 Tax=Microbispora sp. CA-135349 TaxID=3239953 RepID=UPI003D8DDDC7